MSIITLLNLFVSQWYQRCIMAQNPFLFNINHIKDVDLTKDEFIDLKTKKLL